MLRHYKASRRGDYSGFTRHDPSRFVKTRDKWYFRTREGSIEGPFLHPEEAEDSLDHYISMMSWGALSSGVEGIPAKETSPS